jgi:hypothetical protein
VWVFTQNGFYSVVAYDPARDHGGPTRGEDLVLVRARVGDDLEALRRWFPDLEIREHRRADYRFRTVLGRADWKRILEAEVDSLDYTNFKNRVAHNQGHKRHEAYMRVWDAMRQLQPSGPSE